MGQALIFFVTYLFDILLPGDVLAAAAVVLILLRVQPTVNPPLLPEEDYPDPDPTLKKSLDLDPTIKKNRIHILTDNQFSTSITATFFLGC